jgi:hypothetical protein
MKISILAGFGAAAAMGVLRVLITAGSALVLF